MKFRKTADYFLFSTNLLFTGRLLLHTTHQFLLIYKLKRGIFTLFHSDTFFPSLFQFSLSLFSLVYFFQEAGATSCTGFLLKTISSLRSSYPPPVPGFIQLFVLVQKNRSNQKNKKRKGCNRNINNMQ